MLCHTEHRGREQLLNPVCLQNVDLVIEGTGVFVNSEGAGKHITAGAKKVSPAS